MTGKGLSWRVWLATGKWVAVTATDEKDALRKLSRSQRKHATKVVPIPRRAEP